VTPGGEPLRVLIVHSRVGGGHLSAARALAFELESTGRVEPTLIDAYVECGRFPLTTFPTAYAWLARHQPFLWALLFHGSNTCLDATRVLRPFLRDGLRRAVSQIRPHLVVSVLPVVNRLLVEAAAPAPVEVVLTDWHSVHRFWVGHGVRHYTAPTEPARLDCVRFGAPASAVDVVGIPVRRAFARIEDVGALRSRSLAGLGLDPGRFTVLMMVGAEGSPRAFESVARLVQVPIEAQVVVVCGRNEELRKRVEGLRSRVSLRALGFVEHVADLMRSADLLVTKAGGLTLAEAFCCGVPVVVYDVLPGQEAGNLDYVRRQGAVVHAPRPRGLPRLVAELYADAARRGQLAERGRRLARPDATPQIVQRALERLDAPRP
jgi:UDP-N-acetylglucosamine:LPS N-acetylglucosamine transferase